MCTPHIDTAKRKPGTAVTSNEFNAALHLIQSDIMFRSTILHKIANTQ